VPDQPLELATLHIPALDCSEEMALIEKGLRGSPGVGSLSADYLNRALRIQFDPGLTDAAAIASAIQQIGFEAEPVEATDISASELSAARPQTTTLIGGVLLLLAAIFRWTEGATTLPIVLLTIASTLVSGAAVARAAWRAIRLRALDMNALMTIAAVGAIATGEYFEAATAMFLFSVALWLERFSMNRARRAVQTLVELTPAVAHRVTASKETEDVDPDQLIEGDAVRVLPGERVPIDGVVTGGGSSIDQSAITGESIPAEKQPGDDVFAGTLNHEGSLEVRVTRVARQSTLAHIQELIRDASSSRSPTERFVDRFARYYTPAVIAAAVVLAFGPPLAARLGAGWAASADASAWFHRGLVLLVIACPCALVISTPVTIVCGLYRAARRGILIKGGEHLESAGRIDSIALDKTGTLTTGELAVEEISAPPGVTEDEVLALAATLEQFSEHPLATAILAEAKRLNLPLSKVEEFSALRGYGIEAQVAGQVCLVGAERLLRQRDVEVELEANHDSMTAVFVARNGLHLGTIWLSDTPRDGAQSAIESLKRLGVSPVAMLTGDRQSIADRLAKQLGLDEVHADLLPEDKVERVKTLAAARPYLAMVGDGVNDAPALAAAPVGIAMGKQASDTALETADVVILTPQLSRLPELVRLGRRVRSILWQNISLALAPKLAVLILAALGMATMWMAVAADVGASLIVIANGMRLLGQVER
jgi:Cd2+/Zn2+-exporting ATPase